MAKSVFTVDLGTMELSDDQKMEINTAIQTAVTGVLAKSGAKTTSTVLFPINNFPRGPIIWGFVARNLKDLRIDIADIVANH